MLPDDEIIISFHTESMLLGNFAHLKKMSQENVSCNEKWFFFLCIFEITLQVPCGEQLAEWFEENKITWVTILASVAALQVMCVGIAIYILSRIKRQKKLRYVAQCSKIFLKSKSVVEFLN